MALKKIIVDTCVIESALRSKSGASYQILSRIHTGLFRFGISVPLYLEYEYRIEELYSQKIIAISTAGKEAILKALAHYSDEVPIFYTVRPNLKDENDNMVFECAVNFNANAIVTHNIKDFVRGDLSPYAIDIITPQQFLKEVR
ncbi:MAG: putative toxin-antitoxin system toxin component, PIN family [Calditrichia bacterium]